jgi:hypothetical protein
LPGPAHANDDTASTAANDFRKAMRKA